MALVGLGLGLEQRGGVMGHTIESKFRAQVGLGTLMPYISPPFDLYPVPENKSRDRKSVV